MRKYFSLFAAVAIVATSFISCSKESTPLVKEQDRQTIKISFNAQTQEPSTKTYFGDKTDAGYPTRWSTEQQVKVSINCKESYSSDASVTPSADGKTASFEADFSGADGDPNPLYFFAISPASAVKGYITSWSMLKFSVPTEQTPTMNSVDEAAHILGANNETPYYYSSLPENVTLKFSHIAAYGRFMLKNFPDDITIRSIEISSSEYITGSYMYPANEYYTEGTFEQSKTLTINPSKLSSVSNTSKVFWFSVLPVDLRGKTITVKVTTSNGIYTKQATFPNNGSDQGNFKAGLVNNFTLNMNGIEPEPLRYRLVTDYAELTEGSEFVIGSTAYNKAMAITMTNEYPWRNDADIVKSSDKLTIENPGDDVQIFTLRKGSADNTVMLECKNGDYAGQYIGAKLTANPTDLSWSYLFNCTAATSERGISFNVHLEDTGDATMGPYNTQNNYKYLSYKASSKLFCMENAYLTDKALAIYKLEGTGEGEQLIIPEPEFHFTSGVNIPDGYAGMHYVGNTMYLPAAGGTYTVEFEIKYPKDGGYVQNSIQINGGGATTIEGLTATMNVSENKIVVTLPQNTSSNSRSAYMVLEYSYKEDGKWVNLHQWLYIAQAGVSVPK